MLKVRFTNQFKKEYKKALKQKKPVKKLFSIIEKLAKSEILPESNKDHSLTGDFKGCRECHIEPDWLLIYKQNQEELVLQLMRLGSHSDLFG